MTSPKQSPLISLPGELKNEIFKLALSSTTPIINPHHETSSRPKHRHIPQLGAALSQTCCSINADLDTRPLYKNNSFVFTRIAHIHAFYSRLSREQMRWIRSITLDLREASPCFSEQEIVGDAEVVGNEWLHYMGCDYHAHAPGMWCASLPTMSSDLPDVKELVLDLTGWQSPFAGSRRGGWRFLQRLLGNVKGLDGMVLKGKCLDSKFWNPRPAPWGLAPWFSPAFCNDDVSLLSLIGAGVRDAEAGEKKVFAWKLQDGVTTLEVKIVDARKQSLAVDTKLPTKVPDCGMATWEAFLETSAERQGEESGKLAPPNPADSGPAEAR